MFAVGPRSGHTTPPLPPDATVAVSTELPFRIRKESVADLPDISGPRFIPQADLTPETSLARQYGPPVSVCVCSVCVLFVCLC